MERNYSHGKTTLCTLRIKQIDTGFVRVRHKRLTPEQIKTYQQRINVPESNFVLVSIELE